MWFDKIKKATLAGIEWRARRAMREFGSSIDEKGKVRLGHY